MRGAGRRAARWLWRPLRAVLLGLLIAVIFIEEWGWRPLTALAARVARWPPLAAIEGAIRNAPPIVALTLFLVPALLLFPIKVIALWLIQQRHATLGIAVIVAAKVFGTAFVGRLFILVEPQLMTFRWFARGLGWWRATRREVMTTLHRSWIWRVGRAFRGVARRWLLRLRALGDDRS